MTVFDKYKFDISNAYISYERRFVAKFKYKPRNAPGFVSFLIKNFTVEEFFGRVDAGESIDLIAESKGYLQPHIRKLLVEAGLPVTPAGRDEYLRLEKEARAARQSAEATLVPSQSAGMEFDDFRRRR
jgi:hypothetical protein